MSRVIEPRPDDGELKTTSLRIGERLMQKIDAIAEDNGYSRNEALVILLRWAVQEHEADAAQKKAAKR